MGSNNRVLNNARWIVICRALQSLVQMVIGMISARYLGPSDYGLIAYAAAVVSFAVPIMELGMSSTLVKEYVADPAREGQTLGTALVMNALSGLACMVGVACFVAIANPGETETLIVCVLYSITLVTQVPLTIQYWFQAKLQSKYSSIAVLVAYVFVSVYRIYLLIAKKNVYWFALAHALEYGFAGILLLYFYKTHGAQKITVSFARAKEIFRRSRYYIISALMVNIYQNTDQIMLKTLVDDSENGFFKTALTCTVIVSFVYDAVIESMRPVILSAKKTSQEAFNIGLSSLYTVMIYMALAQGIAFTLLAKPIINILYGAEFLPAVPVLQILVWQVGFSFIGLVRNIWILGEEKHKALWKINLGGVITNICMNAILIPLWGARGAALASVITQLFTHVILGFVIKEIQPNNRLMLQGLNPKNALYLVQKLRKKA